MSKTILSSFLFCGLLTASIYDLKAGELSVDVDNTAGETLLTGDNYDAFVEQVARELIKARQEQGGEQTINQGGKGAKKQARQINRKVHMAAVKAGKKAAQEFVSEKITRRNFKNLMKREKVSKAFKKAYATEYQKHTGKNKS